VVAAERSAPRTSRQRAVRQGVEAPVYELRRQVWQAGEGAGQRQWFQRLRVAQCRRGVVRHRH